MSVCRGGFAAGDKVTYNATELLCHGCVVATTSAPERPTHVSPVQSVATRPQEIAVGDQLHSPDSVFSTSGKSSICWLWFGPVQHLTVLMALTVSHIGLHRFMPKLHLADLSKTCPLVASADTDLSVSGMF